MGKSHLPALGRVILAHGAGSSRSHPHILRLASLLQTAGNAVTTFDFPFRLQGRSFPDKMPVLLESLRQQIDVVGRSAQGLPLFLAGHSMGGRAALRLAAGEIDAGATIAGVILFSYPLRALGGKEELRLEGFSECSAAEIPVLLLSGERDAMAPPELQADVLGKWAGLKRITLPGLDHFWSAKAAGPKSETVDAIVVDALRDWQQEILLPNPAN